MLYRMRKIVINLFLCLIAVPAAEVPIPKVKIKASKLSSNDLYTISSLSSEFILFFKILINKYK